MSARRSGRRPGDTDTKTQILDAARELFAANGIDKTSIRAIAAAAGVDPALVHHYFGTKHQLFVTAVEFPFDPSVILDQLDATEFNDLGAQIIRTVLTIWDSDFQSAGVAILRSNLAATDAGLLRPFLSEFILANIGSRMTGNDAAKRAGLVASQVIGLIIARYLVKLEPIVSMSIEEAADAVGPTLQRYLAG